MKRVYTVLQLSSAHADGWIGLYVGSYDVTGKWTGAVVDQQITYGAMLPGSEAPADSRRRTPVDQDPQYMICVWCGGDISADGMGAAFGEWRFELHQGSRPGDKLGARVNGSIPWVFSRDVCITLRNATLRTPPPLHCMPTTPEGYRWPRSRSRAPARRFPLHRLEAAH